MRGQRGEPRVKISVVVLILMLFMGGSAVGAFMETGIDSGERNSGIQYINGILAGESQQDEGISVFKESLKSNGKLLMIMGISGATVIFFPAAMAVIVYKGMALGFTSSLIMEGSADKGILESCAALLPQNLVIIPLMGIYGYFTICMAMSVIGCRNKRYRGRIYADNIKVYFLITVFSTVGLCAASAIEGFINPLLSVII